MAAAAWKDVTALPEDLAFRGDGLKLPAQMKDKRNQILKLFCLCFLQLMVQFDFIIEQQELYGKSLFGALHLCASAA